ncbi:hypothetical protein KFZ48_25575, partial [Salmonella enterica subsp. enterica serovar 1,4,[5],12:i:-]|nr:hypothetical protein [Salmonella enterica subsp. enterica serovar 1,4,[5],12:i:-]
IYQLVHFGVTKKDPSLFIRFHVLNLSKSWSNLGFDQDSKGKNKKHKNEKPNHILCLMKSSMKRSGFGFQTWKFQKPPKSFILE